MSSFLLESHREAIRSEEMLVKAKLAVPVDDCDPRWDELSDRAEMLQKELQDIHFRFRAQLADYAQDFFDIEIAVDTGDFQPGNTPPEDVELEWQHQVVQEVAVKLSKIEQQHRSERWQHDRGHDKFGGHEKFGDTMTPHKHGAGAGIKTPLVGSDKRRASGMNLSAIQACAPATGPLGKAMQDGGGGSPRGRRPSALNAGKSHLGVLGLPQKVNIGGGDISDSKSDVGAYDRGGPLEGVPMPRRSMSRHPSDGELDRRNLNLPVAKSRRMSYQIGAKSVPQGGALLAAMSGKQNDLLDTYLSSHQSQIGKTNSVRSVNATSKYPQNEITRQTSHQPSPVAAAALGLHLETMSNDGARHQHTSLSPTLLANPNMVRRPSRLQDLMGDRPEGAASSFRKPLTATYSGGHKTTNSGGGHDPASKDSHSVDVRHDSKEDTDGPNESVEKGISECSRNRSKDHQAGQMSTEMKDIVRKISRSSRLSKESRGVGLPLTAPKIIVAAPLAFAKTFSKDTQQQPEAPPKPAMSFVQTAIHDCPHRFGKDGHVLNSAAGSRNASRATSKQSNLLVGLHPALQLGRDITEGRSPALPTHRESNASVSQDPDAIALRTSVRYSIGATTAMLNPEDYDHTLMEEIGTALERIDIGDETGEKKTTDVEDTDNNINADNVTPGGSAKRNSLLDLLPKSAADLLGGKQADSGGSGPGGGIGGPHGVVPSSPTTDAAAATNRALGGGSLGGAGRATQHSDGRATVSVGSGLDRSGGSLGGIRGTSTVAPFSTVMQLFLPPQVCSEQGGSNHDFIFAQVGIELGALSDEYIRMMTTYGEIDIVLRPILPELHIYEFPSTPASLKLSMSSSAAAQSNAQLSEGRGTVAVLAHDRERPHTIVVADNLIKSSSLNSGDQPPMGVVTPIRSEKTGSVTPMGVVTPIRSEKKVSNGGANGDAENGTNGGGGNNGNKGDDKSEEKNSRDSEDDGTKYSIFEDVADGMDSGRMTVTSTNFPDVSKIPWAQDHFGMILQTQHGRDMILVRRIWLHMLIWICFILYTCIGTLELGAEDRSYKNGRMDRLLVVNEALHDQYKVDKKPIPFSHIYQGASFSPYFTSKNLDGSTTQRTPDGMNRLIKFEYHPREIYVAHGFDESVKSDRGFVMLSEEKHTTIKVDTSGYVFVQSDAREKIVYKVASETLETPKNIEVIDKFDFKREKIIPQTLDYKVVETDTIVEVEVGEAFPRYCETRKKPNGSLIIVYLVLMTYLIFLLMHGLHKHIAFQTFFSLDNIFLSIGGFFRIAVVTELLDRNCGQRTDMDAMLDISFSFLSALFASILVGSIDALKLRKKNKVMILIVFFFHLVVCYFAKSLDMELVGYDERKFWLFWYEHISLPAHFRSACGWCLLYVIYGLMRISTGEFDFVFFTSHLGLCEGVPDDEYIATISTGSSTESAESTGGLLKFNVTGNSFISGMFKTKDTSHHMDDGNDAYGYSPLDSYHDHHGFGSQMSVNDDYHNHKEGKHWKTLRRSDDPFARTLLGFGPSTSDSSPSWYNRGVQMNRKSNRIVPLPDDPQISAREADSRPGLRPIRAPSGQSDSFSWIDGTSGSSFGRVSAVVQSSSSSSFTMLTQTPRIPKKILRTDVDVEATQGQNSATKVHVGESPTIIGKHESAAVGGATQDGAYTSVCDSGTRLTRRMSKQSKCTDDKNALTENIDEIVTLDGDTKLFKLSGRVAGATKERGYKGVYPDSNVRAAITTDPRTTDPTRSSSHDNAHERKASSKRGCESLDERRLAANGNLRRRGTLRENAKANTTISDAVNEMVSSFKARVHGANPEAMSEATRKSTIKVGPVTIGKQNFRLKGKQDGRSHESVSPIESNRSRNATVDRGQSDRTGEHTDRKSDGNSNLHYRKSDLKSRKRKSRTGRAKADTESTVKGDRIRMEEILGISIEKSSAVYDSFDDENCYRDDRLFQRKSKKDLVSSSAEHDLLDVISDRDEKRAHHLIHNEGHHCSSGPNSPQSGYRSSQWGSQSTGRMSNENERGGKISSGHHGDPGTADMRNSMKSNNPYSKSKSNMRSSGTSSGNPAEGYASARSSLRLAEDGQARRLDRTSAQMNVSLHRLFGQQNQSKSKPLNASNALRTPQKKSIKGQQAVGKMKSVDNFTSGPSIIKSISLSKDRATLDMIGSVNSSMKLEKKQRSSMKTPKSAQSFSPGQKINMDDLDDEMWERARAKAIAQTEGGDSLAGDSAAAAECGAAPDPAGAAGSEAGGSPDAGAPGAKPGSIPGSVPGEGASTDGAAEKGADKAYDERAQADDKGSHANDKGSQVGSHKDSKVSKEKEATGALREAIDFDDPQESALDEASWSVVQAIILTETTWDIAARVQEQVMRTVKVSKRLDQIFARFVTSLIDLGVQNEKREEEAEAERREEKERERREHQSAASNEMLSDFSKEAKITLEEEEHTLGAITEGAESAALIALQKSAAMSEEPSKSPKAEPPKAEPTPPSNTGSEGTCYDDDTMQKSEVGTEYEGVHATAHSLAHENQVDRSPYIDADSMGRLQVIDASTSRSSLASSVDTDRIISSTMIDDTVQYQSHQSVPFIIGTSSSSSSSSSYANGNQLFLQNSVDDLLQINVFDQALHNILTRADNFYTDAHSRERRHSRERDRIKELRGIANSAITERDAYPEFDRRPISDVDHCPDTPQSDRRTNSPVQDGFQDYSRKAYPGDRQDFRAFMEELQQKRGEYRADAGADYGTKYQGLGGFYSGRNRFPKGTNRRFRRNHHTCRDCSNRDYRNINHGRYTNPFPIDNDRFRNRDRLPIDNDRFRSEDEFPIDHHRFRSEDKFPIDHHRFRSEDKFPINHHRFLTDRSQPDGEFLTDRDREGFHHAEETNSPNYSETVKDSPKKAGSKDKSVSNILIKIIKGRKRITKEYMQLRTRVHSGLRLMYSNTDVLSTELNITDSSVARTDASMRAMLHAAQAKKQMLENTQILNMRRQILLSDQLERSCSEVLDFVVANITRKHMGRRSLKTGDALQAAKDKAMGIVKHQSLTVTGNVTVNSGATVAGLTAPNDGNLLVMNSGVVGVMTPSHGPASPSVASPPTGAGHLPGQISDVPTGAVTADAVTAMLSMDTHLSLPPNNSTGKHWDKWENVSNHRENLKDREAQKEKIHRELDELVNVKIRRAYSLGSMRVDSDFNNFLNFLIGSNHYVSSLLRKSNRDEDEEPTMKALPLKSLLKPGQRVTKITNRLVGTGYGLALDDASGTYNVVSHAEGGNNVFTSIPSDIMIKICVEDYERRMDIDLTNPIPILNRDPVCGFYQMVGKVLLDGIVESTFHLQSHMAGRAHLIMETENLAKQMHQTIMRQDSTKNVEEGRVLHTASTLTKSKKTKKRKARQKWMRIRPNKKVLVLGGGALLNGVIGRICANPITLWLMIGTGIIGQMLSMSNARDRDLTDAQIQAPSMPPICKDRKILDPNMQLVQILAFLFGIYCTFHVLHVSILNLTINSLYSRIAFVNLVRMYVAEEVIEFRCEGRTSVEVLVAVIGMITHTGGFSLFITNLDAFIARRWLKELMVLAMIAHFFRIWYIYSVVDFDDLVNGWPLKIWIPIWFESNLAPAEHIVSASGIIVVYLFIGLLRSLLFQQQFTWVRGEYSSKVRHKKQDEQAERSTFMQKLKGLFRRK